MTDALWEQIVREVKHAAQDDASLSGYFYGAILSHTSLESALAHGLAELLGNQVVSSLTLFRVISEGFAADSAIGEKMRQDLLAHFHRDPACDKRYIPLLFFKGFHALQCHRIAHWLWSQGRATMALYLQSRCSELFAVDIHPAARISGGLMIDHATGIVIGETTLIKNNVSMLHGVTLGGTGLATEDRHPKVGAGVLIAAGAKILGNIAIGDGAKIGAGSLVLKPVAAHTTVAGVPARVVGKKLKQLPALEMDQFISQ